MTKPNGSSEYSEARRQFLLAQRGEIDAALAFLDREIEAAKRRPAKLTATLTIRANHPGDHAALEAYARQLEGVLSASKYPVTCYGVICLNPAVSTRFLTLEHTIANGQGSEAIHELTAFYAFAGQVEGIVSASKFPATLALHQEGEIKAGF
jgi:hypothetical protein